MGLSCINPSESERYFLKGLCRFFPFMKILVINHFPGIEIHFIPPMATKK